MAKRTPISVIIAEDTDSSRELLIEYLVFRDELKLEGIAKNGEEALKMLSERRYDLLFLDINLPVFSGIEVLERLDFFPYVIFTTAFDKYAVKAFDVGAVDYLLKPFTLERFNQAVDRALSMINDKIEYFKTPKILGMSFSFDNKNFLIPYDDVIYASSNIRCSILHTAEEEFKTSLMLKDIERRLPEGFLRIHKQYIVNMKYVFKLEYISSGRHEVTLNDKKKTRLPVGKVYCNNLRNEMNG